ncbi:MAG: SMODS domain-containing nucleotidyltransferase [Chitinophagales bacterium]
MSVSNWFETFSKNLRMSNNTVSNIQSRYKAITKRINLDYHNSSSETANSLYVGSYGRGTDIVVSDVDVLVRLPYETYKKFNSYSGNGQSALLQEVKTVIQKTYSKTHLRGDGQVIVIKFSDGIIFEIVPGFSNKDKISYTYPDTNNGGSWKVTNPKAEINEINRANNEWNKNLKRLCRMARAWKYKWDVPIGGLLIDTLAYNFMKNWTYKDKSYLYYDYMSRDFFKFLKDQKTEQSYWYAPGSNQLVYRKGSFEYKAKRCYNISLEAIEKEKYPTTAKPKWREIYGTKFPS